MIWDVETSLGCKAEDSGFIFPVVNLFVFQRVQIGIQDPFQGAKAYFSLSGGKGQYVFHTWIHCFGFLAYNTDHHIHVV